MTNSNIKHTAETEQPTAKGEIAMKCTTNPGTPAQYDSLSPVICAHYDPNEHMMRFKGKLSPVIVAHYDDLVAIAGEGGWDDEDEERVAQMYDLTVYDAAAALNRVQHVQYWINAVAVKHANAIAPTNAEIAAAKVYSEGEMAALYSKVWRTLHAAAVARLREHLAQIVSAPDYEEEIRKITLD